LYRDAAPNVHQARPDARQPGLAAARSRGWNHTRAWFSATGLL